MPFDDLVAASFGYLSGLSHSARKRPRTRVSDPMIAATAHHPGIPLITRNAVDFDAISHQVQTLARLKLVPGSQRLRQHDRDRDGPAQRAPVA